MKRYFIFVLLIFFIKTAFASQNLDEALFIAATDIAEKCEAKAILVIDDFESPSKAMTLYIREQLADLIYSEDGLIQIATREHMDLIEKEMQFQNSGIVSADTILSVAERLGAESVVFGKLDELNGGYILRVRMLDIKTASYKFRKTYEIARSSKTEQLLGREAVWYKAAIGAHIEANKNSLDFIAPAVGITFDYGLARKFSLGAKLIASYDIQEKDNTLFIMEPLFAIRCYLVSPSGEPVSGLFIEGQAGISLIFVNSEMTNTFNAGGAIGFRFVSNNFYIEPIFRGGYPYLFGLGITTGFRF